MARKQRTVNTNKAGKKCGIHRVEKCIGLPSRHRGLLMHALREGVAVPNADPSKTHLNTVLAGAPTVAECMQRMRDAIATHNENAASVNNGRSFRKDGVSAIDLFFGGSSQAIDEMDESTQNKYFNDCLNWALKTYLGTTDRNDPRVLVAAIHRDETTAHMHVMLTPLIEGRLRGSDLIGNKRRLHELQNSFFDQVSSKYGLERGEIGSRARHVDNMTLYKNRQRSIDELRGGQYPQPAPLPDVVPEPKPNMLGRVNAEQRQQRDAYVSRIEQVSQHNADVAAQLRDALALAMSEPVEFKARRAELRKQEATLRKRGRRVRRVRDGLKERLMDVKKQQQDLNTQQARLDDLVREQVAQKIAAARAALDERARDLARREERLQERESTLATDQRNLETTVAQKVQAAVQPQLQEVSQRRRDVDTEKAKLDAQKEALEKRHEQLKAEEVQQHQKRNELRDKERAIEDTVQQRTQQQLTGITQALRGHVKKLMTYEQLNWPTYEHAEFDAVDRCQSAQTLMDWHSQLHTRALSIGKDGKPSSQKPEFIKRQPKQPQQKQQHMHSPFMKR